MSVKQNIKFNVRDEMLKDSKDLLDNVEVTTVAQECVKLKKKEDEIAALEEQLKSKNSAKEFGLYNSNILFFIS